MNYQKYLDRADLSYQESKNSFRKKLERHKDFKVLELVLEMDSFECYQLFGFGNQTLLDMQTLESLLVNGFLDDSQLGVVCYQLFDEHYQLRVETIHDDSGVNVLNQLDLIKVINSINTSHNFYKDNSSEIESCVIDNQKHNKWKDLEKLTEDLLIELASDEVKEKYLSKKQKVRDSILELIK